VFDHVTIRASNGEASKQFYETVLASLEVELHEGDGWTAWGDYDLFVFEDPTPTRRLHVGFAAPSREYVDEFWRVGTDAGYESDGEPGPRPQYSQTYYGAFLLDPDGNSAEAVHADWETGRGLIDHLWLRVADVRASTRFFATIAPWARFFVRPRSPERTQLIGETDSFSVVRGTPTENVHIAFTADEDWFVDEFHRAAVEAGYRDNGGPGERDYHAGYYSAFVLDPDANNIEVVNHNRG
jgi:catechol 2,3-dioxygenase-like lactoylglutathione lyase family enzyme